MPQVDKEQTPITELPYNIGEGDTTSKDKAQTNFDAIVAALPKNYAYKVTRSGSTSYAAFAKPGSLESQPVWLCQKILGNATITYADGNTNFDNIATNLLTLNYS